MAIAVPLNSLDDVYRVSAVDASSVIVHQPVNTAVGDVLVALVYSRGATLLSNYGGWQSQTYSGLGWDGLPAWSYVGVYTWGITDSSQIDPTGYQFQRSDNTVTDLLSVMVLRVTGADPAHPIAAMASWSATSPSGVGNADVDMSAVIAPNSTDYFRLLAWCGEGGTESGQFAATQSSGTPILQWAAPATGHGYQADWMSGQVDPTTQITPITLGYSTAGVTTVEGTALLLQAPGIWKQPGPAVSIVNADGTETAGTMSYYDGTSEVPIISGEIVQ